MLENVKNLLSDGVTALGGILIVFGLVNLGLTIKDGMQGGGGVVVKLFCNTKG